MRRDSALHLVIAAALVLQLAGWIDGSCVTAAEAKQNAPNVVLILADDLGYGDLSSYGGKDLRTPHVDGLMAAGARLDQFYANSPVCSPTRAALLTGRYPDRVGVPGVIRTHAPDSWGHLAENAILLPSLLQRFGYHTALVGKWHLGLDPANTPLRRGFDHFHGFLGDMMDDYNTHRRHGINYMRLGQEEIDPPGHATDLFTRWAVSYIRERKDKRGPFFLYLAYNAPHTPIQPPPQRLAKVKVREPQLDEKRARLVALIEHMDDGIGQVLAALQETGQAERTLVVFTSDNGGDLGAGGTVGGLRGGKGDVYEGGLRVPFCAVWPGSIKAGRRISPSAMTMDLLPTICEAAGVPVEHHIDGISLLPLLLGTRQQLPERDLYWIRREGNNRYMGLTIEALRRGDWKLVHNGPDKPFELFNLAEDPLEQNDLSKKNRAVFEQLAAALRQHVQEGGRVPWQPPKPQHR